MYTHKQTIIPRLSPDLSLSLDFVHRRRIDYPCLHTTCGTLRKHCQLSLASLCEWFAWSTLGPISQEAATQPHILLLVLYFE